MTTTDYDLIAGSLSRTIHVTEFLEKNQIRKQAKLAALRLLASDLAGKIYSRDKSFDRDRFLNECGVQG